jgi:hypothetical protein
VRSASARSTAIRASARVTASTSPRPPRGSRSRRTASSATTARAASFWR